MRYLSLLTLLLSAVPALAQENDAEKLYRAMEKKIRDCQTLRFSFTGEAIADGKKIVALKGTVQVAEGNKGRIESDFAAAGKSLKLLVISDGQNKYTKEGDQARTEPVDRKDSAVPLAMMARFGLTAAVVLARPEGKVKEEFDIDKELPVKNFKFSVKEKVGKRQAQVVVFEMTVVGDVQARVAVWIDTETQLPLKRTLTVDGKGKNDMVHVVETFTNFTINPKLDAKVFEIPK
jgi:outer membrane lipoprotein-sorting protein